MLGAIIGDIVGSRFEWENYKGKDFELFTKECMPTDDSIMSLAIGAGLLKSQPDYENLEKNTIDCMQSLGRQYPYCGYGVNFYFWIFGDDPKPYNSYGNGASMRVSAAGTVASSLEEALALSKRVTSISHNHPEGIKGAQATAAAIYLAKTGSTKEEIKDYINQNFYKIDFTLDEIRDTYEFNEICQRTVPQALEAFFESMDYEDAIRNAISIGGDSDTIGAICGSIAEAYYGIPVNIRNQALSYLDDTLTLCLKQFEEAYPPVIISGEKPIDLPMV